MAAIDIITLAEAKTQLNITSNTNDAELAPFITAASTMWVNRVGPVNSGSGVGTYDEWFDGGSDRIVVRHSPVLAVTAVEESWGAILYTLVEQTLQSGGNLGPFGYSIDKTIGTITRRSVGIATTFASGVRNIHVSYTAGFAAVPEDIKLAVKLLVQHMWETQRGGGKRPGQGGDEYTPSASYAWPYRVEEIAQAYRGPGVA